MAHENGPVAVAARSRAALVVAVAAVALVAGVGQAAARASAEGTPTETAQVTSPEVPAATTARELTRTVEQTVTETVPAPPASVTVTHTLTTADVPESTSSSTQWGWIAFGILAAAVIIGAIVMLVRGRSSGKDEEAPPAANLPA